MYYFLIDPYYYEETLKEYIILWSWSNLVEIETNKNLRANCKHPTIKK